MVIRLAEENNNCMMSSRKPLSPMSVKEGRVKKNYGEQDLPDMHLETKSDHYKTEQ
jgi:hypothetical protein